LHNQKKYSCFGGNCKKNPLQMTIELKEFRWIKNPYQRREVIKENIHFLFTIQKNLTVKDLFGFKPQVINQQLVYLRKELKAVELIIQSIENETLF